MVYGRKTVVNLLYSVWAMRQYLPLPGHEKPRYANSSRTGHGNHGDYMFGWKGDSLQRALNARCDNDKCRELERQADEEAMKCKIAQKAVEDVGNNNCKSGCKGIVM